MGELREPKTLRTSVVRGGQRPCEQWQVKMGMVMEVGKTEQVTVLVEGCWPRWRVLLVVVGVARAVLRALVWEVTGRSAASPFPAWIQGHSRRRVQCIEAHPQ